MSHDFEIQRIVPRVITRGWQRIHDPQCTNAPCDCASRGSLVYERIADVFGDCIGCDGYILAALEDHPYCQSCARLKREGKEL